MSVILIGMPSCGKSTLGVLLAKQLGYRFIDSDLLIQESEGKLLHEIIAEKGKNGFISIEERVNAAIAENNAVIATGGSVIYGERAMENLKKLGKIVYLELSYDEMCSRLGDYSHRGVVMRSGTTLADMYAERKPLYEKYADITVRVCNADLTENVSKICAALAK
ncbi:MAG: shikimate kinase [Clostridia bacterium]|nr:shikimate kinase [Clostridia bacterium]